MIGKNNKIQLNKISQIINREFGILSETGEIIYYSLEQIPDKTFIIPTEFIESSDDSKDYATQGDYCFFKYINSDSLIYFFMESGSNPEDDKRVLQLAAIAFENREEVHKRKINEFYQTLMIDGPKAITPGDYAQYGILSTKGFVIVLISINSDEYISQGEMEMSIVLLKGIFSLLQNIQVVTLNNQKLAVVCGLNEDSDYMSVIEVSETIKDTLVSEIMVDMNVSVGSVVIKISDLYISYRDAEIAREAGLIFGLTQKSYAYDKMGIERLIYGIPVRNCVSFLKETLGTEFLKDKGAKELLSTVKTFLDNNQNVSESARALYIHRNTLVYRLDKFNKLTNLDSTKFEEGMKIGIALMIMKYLEKKAPNELEF